MPKLTKEIKEQIKALSANELFEIVLKFASKDKAVYDFIEVNYLNKESGEQQLYEKTLEDLDLLYSKRYKGYSDELKLANMLAAYIKRINEFTKVSKNKVLEAELLVTILDETFSESTDLLGTCFTQYDTKLAIIVKRLITLVTQNLHEDYRIEYIERINGFLEILHRKSNHIDTIYNLPKSI